MRIVGDATSQGAGSKVEHFLDPLLITDYQRFTTLIDLRLESPRHEGLDLSHLSADWSDQEEISRLVTLEVRSPALASMVDFYCERSTVMGRDFERGIIVNGLGVLLSLVVTGYRRSPLHFLADLCQYSRVRIGKGLDSFILFPTLASHFLGWWPNGYEDVTRSQNSLIVLQD